MRKKASERKKMDIKKEITREIKRHHIIHYLGLPLLLIGSDLFIGFYGHFSGSSNIFSIDAFLLYLTSAEELTELSMVFVVAIVITVIVEWIIRERIKHHKR